MKTHSLVTKPLNLWWLASFSPYLRSFSPPNRSRRPHRCGIPKSCGRLHLSILNLVLLTQWPDHRFEICWNSHRV